MSEIDGIQNFGTYLPMPSINAYGGLDSLGISTPMFNASQFMMPSVDTFGSFGTAQQLPYGFGDLWAENLQQTALKGIFAILQKFQLPSVDLSSFNLGLSAPTETSPKNTPSTPTVSATQSYGNNTKKATDLFTGTGEDLNKGLKGVLAGKGDKLIELQNKYGINAALLAAIVTTESGYGKSNAAKTKNNVAGIMSKESGYMKLATFSSVDACLEALAKNLKKNYVDKGLVTISQIHSKYCPVGAANDPNNLNSNWGRNVTQLTREFENYA